MSPRVLAEKSWSADRFKVREEVIIVNRVSRDAHGWAIHAELQIEIELPDGTIIETYETHVLEANEPGKVGAG